MIYQVVSKRVGVGQGVWHDRPYGPTAEFQQAREQYANVQDRWPRPVGVVILAGESVEDLNEQYAAYVNGRTARVVDPTENGVREALEFAPLRAEYPPPRYSIPFADWSWGPALGPLLRLMARIHKGELGGSHDGEGEDSGPEQVPD